MKEQTKQMYKHINICIQTKEKEKKYDVIVKNDDGK